MTQLGIYDILVQSAVKGVELQRPDGSFPKGHNGPWHDEDTYVRTTAHWAITLFKAYEITKDQYLLDSAIRACDYLLTQEARPYQKTFYCRTKLTKSNMCNGPIGQAWAVEPLLILGKALDNKNYLSVAEEVLSLHPYCYERHGWLNTEIDGQVLGLNSAFNQQVWFSTMVLLAGQRNQELLTKARDLFKNIPNIIDFLEVGLIKHTYRKKSNQNIKQLAKDVTGFYFYPGHIVRIKKLSLGYLSFVLYGLAIGYSNFPEVSIWGPSFKSIVKDAIDYAISQYPLDYLGGNEFQWGYNPTGIEMAYTLQVFGDYLNLRNVEDNILKWLTKQFNGYYDLSTNLMRRNSGDENILMARIYEATRLKNYRVNIHEET